MREIDIGLTKPLIVPNIWDVHMKANSWHRYEEDFKRRFIRPITSKLPKIHFSEDALRRIFVIYVYAVSIFVIILVLRGGKWY